MEKRVYVYVVPDGKTMPTVEELQAIGNPSKDFKIQEEPAPGSGHNLVSPKKLAEIFNVSRQTIHNWRRAGVIVGFTLGGKIYYDADAIIAAMRKRGATHS